MVGVDTGVQRTRYRHFPDHPLYHVSQGVLDAARRVTREAAVWKDLDAELADAIADSVVAAIIEHGFEITPKGVS